MSSHLAHRLFCILALLALVFQPLSAVAVAAPSRDAPDPFAAGIHPVDPQHPGFLFRALIPVKTDRDLTRMVAAGALLLRTVGEGDARTALVLADGDQLADLVRLGFRPQAADELRLLVTAQGPDKAWLVRSLAPALEKADAVAAVREREAANAEAQTDEASAVKSPEAVQALSELRSALAGVTVEQQAGIADSVSVDDDADGLTNTQEAWWCTTIDDPDTDDDGRTDGAEIQALKDWMANKRESAPGETPWPNWPFNSTTCPDKDHDSIPNLAERWDLGLNMDLESSDRDRYDDGQELFGVTYCPGSGNACGYGQLPSANHDGILLFPQMPSFVAAPGKHPLAAALPRLNFSLTPAGDGSTFSIQTTTVVTTDERHEEGESKSYSTTKTEGTSTAEAETQTWENWQEYSKTTEASALALSEQSMAPQDTIISSTEQRLQVTNVQMNSTTNNTMKVKIKNAYFNEPEKPSILKQIEAPVTSMVIDEACKEIGCRKYIGSGIRASVRTFADVVGGTLLGTSDKIQNEFAANHCDPSSFNPGQILCRIKSAGTLWKKNYDERLAAATTEEQEANGVTAGNYLQTNANSLDMSRLFPVSFPAPRFVPTETTTTGSSTGGARTTTHTTYEEYAVTEGSTKQFGKSWGTATAQNSAHAADLWFAYSISNDGTDYARSICDVAINIFIGDGNAPAATYFPATDLGGDGCFSNFRPGEAHKYSFATQSRIALTLPQMAALDQGASLRAVIEDYSLGQDDFYSDDAMGADVQIGIEDGISDGNEDIDNYLIPTWGTETVLDVLARYFPNTVDGNGLLTAIWTPEYRADTPGWCDAPYHTGGTLWCRHALSTADWWNVYSSGMGDGSEGFQDTGASPGQVALFRFNADSDLDGFSDRSEERFGTDPHDAASLPRPELLAGVNSIQNGKLVTATLSLLNTGPYDAYGVEAVMIAPSNTISITNNTVGGSGRVRAQKQVIVGSQTALQNPMPNAWTQTGHAKPAAGGYYTGLNDRTYTFTVQSCGAGGCNVGTGTWLLHWDDGKGANGNLNFANGYQSPSFVDVGTLGVKLALYTGKVNNGESFTVAANTPRDTFQYTIADGHLTDYTRPIVIVSYNDPQGNHRFIIPPAAMSLTSPTTDLTQFSGQMLDTPAVEIVTERAFAPGAGSTSALVNNPTETALTDAHVLLDFVDSAGIVVGEFSADRSLPPGPSAVAVAWDTGAFDPAYNPQEEYLVIAYVTDYQGNILGTAARPLVSFQPDPGPTFAMRAADATWDFGTAKQGTLLRRSFTFGNTGAADLLTYVSAPAGISVPQTGSRTVGPADTATYTMTLNTASLPLGAYDGTITVRTSDPAKPTQTVHVTGNVTQGVTDAPVGALQRPLDTPANVTGNLGEWKEFSHSLGPNPETLHPVKVYSQDYGMFWGAGKYATAFAEGTSSYEMFGDGRDGTMPTSGNLDNNNGAGFGIVNSGPKDTNTLNVTDAYAGWRIGVGDKVLIHQTQGAGAGCWELNKAVSDYTGGTTNFQVEKPLQCNYTSGGNNHAQIVRVPQYATCDVTGSMTHLSAWNGTWGGILAVLCNGTLNVQGTIYSDGGNGATGTDGNPGGGSGGGFRGGKADAVNNDNYGGGDAGEGFPGPGSWDGDGTPNGNGGGAGDGLPSRGNYGTGGGGGNGSAGTASTSGGVGYGGSEAGNLELTNMVFGGGGGGSNDNPGNSVGGGGGGGGIILLQAATININGSVHANGGQGGGYKWAGGAGAGGSILLRGKTVNVGSSKVNATGGSAHNNGGSGGVGRIRAEFCESFDYGTTNPQRTFAKLNCYLAEQIEAFPYNTGRVNLPESGTHTYQVQYGRKLNYSGADDQVVTLRVPAGLFNAITLQALVSDMPSNGNLTVDVGNDGLDLWSLPVANAGQYTSANLAPAFNAYWSSHDAPTSGTIDVPVKVTLDRAGQVFLTNVQATLSGSKTRFLRLPVQPSGYSSVTANLTIGGGSGPLSLAADVGDDGSIDWTSNTTPAAYPVSLTTGNLAGAINAYLAGKTGEPDVPIRFYLTPFVTGFDMTDFTATPNGQPDGQLAQADISFSATSPTEGDSVTVTAVVHNPGSLPTGPIAVSFHATTAEWGEWYVGSAFVPDVPAGGSASAPIEWNTLGFTGDTPVTVRVDPANRLPESNESNNAATKNLTVKTRPDLRVKQIDLSNPEPMAGESVTVKVTLRNDGQTAATASHLVLYDGNPDSGGVQLGEANAAVAAGAETAIDLPWTPTVAGPHKLFVRADLDRQVGESDEGNNDGWRDVHVGLASPLLIDSGNGDAYDPAYTPEFGFGYLNGVDMRCGSDVASTQRSSEPSDTLQYRFDNLLPGHYYHLDLTFAACDGLSREQEIKFDDNVIEAAVLMDGITPVQRSYRLDPALYADRSLVLTIREPGGNPALVAEVNLYDIDYRYADSGHSSNNLDPLDPIYPAAPAGRPQRMHGWLDGQTSQPTGWGTLPYQTRRLDSYDSNPADDPDKELRYRFDGLRSTLHYQLHMSFWIKSGSAVKHTIGVDEIGTGVTVDTVAAQPPSNIIVDVPPGAYTGDGSIVVKITRAEAGVNGGAFVNEIALEELTQLPNTPVEQRITLATGGPNWISFYVKPPVRPATSCEGVARTSQSATLFGDAFLGAGVAPAGSLVEAYNPSGVKTGCFKIAADGVIGLFPIYGAEGSTPGMQPGDPIILKINGIAANPTPYPIIWQSGAVLEVDLNAPDVIPVETLLAPIMAQVTKLQCENGTYLPPPADPRFNTCATVEPGRMVMIWVNSAVQLKVVGELVAPEKPLSLHSGYNWLGYLPTCELTVATALPSIAGKYDIIRSESGGYRPPPADPIYNTFNSLAPGRGYMIHMTEAATLTYPAGLCGGAK